MNKKLFHSILPKLVSMTLALSMFSSLGFASDEKIKNAQMTECRKNFCVTLNSPKLFKSSLGKMYAFGPSQIKINFPGKLVKNDFQDFEGSFDPQISRFYLSKKGAKYEYVIDGEAQQVYRFLNR